MNIILSGIDHSCADLARRERFALSAEQQKEVYARAAEHPGVLGVVTLSTCNRTELYVSVEDGVQLPPFSLLAHVPQAEWEGCAVLETEAAFFHLASMASGLKSRIFAEDQILTQVKAALRQARAHHAADSALEVFFRTAVTAAKRIKTELQFSHGDVAAATAAKDLICADTSVRRVLVIGNGEMGRACAASLAAAGLEVSMTLRQYRHGAPQIPHGVTAIDYAERYRAMERFDAVVSATASPHYTVKADELSGCTSLPRLYLDLAMPRDIDPAVALLPHTRVFDIDQIADSSGVRCRQSEKLAQAEAIIGQGLRDVQSWVRGRAQCAAEQRRTHFPLFVECAGRQVLVVGAGKIATRRALSLCKFDFEVTVVAPEASPEIERLAACGRVELLRRAFCDDDLDDCFLVVAATDDRRVNHRVAELARHREVFASIADKAAECTFYFPALAESGAITAGVCGDGTSHHQVAKAAKTIREALNHETD